MAEALRLTFGWRGTHELSDVLAVPPEEWTVPFATMAEECSLEIDATEAFDQAEQYFEQMTSAD